ncbi:MAG: hypothetical protein Q8L49_01150 [Burkholderiaceae bacterium]|nr:hypothetical protein [Burkholderiaceae bacterium]
MKQVQKTIGHWVQRLAGQGRSQSAVQPVRQPTELDAKALRQVSGGGGGSAGTPTKGW